jgi:hypothetical protein
MLGETSDNDVLESRCWRKTRQVIIAIAVEDSDRENNRAILLPLKVNLPKAQEGRCDGLLE